MSNNNRKWWIKQLAKQNCVKVLKKAKAQVVIGLFLTIVLFSITVIIRAKARDSLAQFIVSTLTVIPLSVLVRITTEDIIVRFQSEARELAVGLASAILGNCIEMCFAIMAVTQNDAIVAQTGLTGSVLANCLLIMGTCFLCGGFQNGDQTYPVIMARDKAQLLLLSLASIVLPTVFKLSSQAQQGLLEVSRSSAIVLLIVFVFYLGYCYHRHTAKEEEELSIALGVAVASQVSSAPVPIAFRAIDLKALRAKSLEASERCPKFSLIVNFTILAFSLILIAVTSLFVVQSIEAPHIAIGVSKSFVGLVIIPVVYGCVEQVITAVRSQAANIDWIIDIAVDSSIRISLFVLPVAVFAGWTTGLDSMNLFFDGFQVTTMGLAVILVNYIMHTGCSHWIQGVILISSFILFAIAAWYYPNEA